MSEFTENDFDRTAAIEDEETRVGPNAKPKPSFADLDALADLHARVSKEETAVTMLSRRVSALEERARGAYNGDDPMAGIPWGLLIAGLVAVQLLPILIDVVKQCRLSSSSG